MHEAKAVPYLSSPTDRRGSAADLVGERKAQSHSDSATATPQTRVEGELQPLLLWPSSISDTHAHSNVQWPTGIGAARMRNLSHL